MKTKEIEVYIEKDWLLSTGCIGMISEASKFPTRLNGKDTIKARLIIELPEKKVEITEEKLDELHNDFQYCADENAFFYKFLKQKLFGSEG